MALGSTQPLTEMSTGNISRGKGGRCVGLTTLPPSCAGCLEIWEPQHPGTLRACPGIAVPFYAISGMATCEATVSVKSYPFSIIFQLVPLQSGPHIQLILRCQYDDVSQCYVLPALTSQVHPV